jgi:Fe-S-cluster containining protein
MKNIKPFPIPVRVRYSCSKCPAWCCTYDEIEITQRDIERLARHFGLDFEAAQEKFTKLKGPAHLLRHKKDKIFDTACMFLDQEKRRCTIYEARPGVCRKYPDAKRCGYYDFLTFERTQQGDQEIIAMT